MSGNLLERSAKLLRAPWVFVALAVGLTAVFGYAIPKLQFDTDVRSMLPENNRDRRVDHYYDHDDRFGSSDSIYVGIKAQDIYTVEHLRHVRRLQDAIEGLNNTLPAESLAKVLKLSPEEGKKALEALRGVGINAGNYQETMVPLLRSAENLKSTFGWDDALAQKVAKSAQGVAPKALFDAYLNPITKTQSLLNADYIANEDDSLVVKKLMDDGELTAEAVAGLKKRVESWEIYRGAIVAEDGTLSLIVVTLEPKEGAFKDRAEQAIEELLRANADPAFPTVLDGEPVIQAMLGRAIFDDIKLLLPLVVLLVILVLFLFFRCVEGVVYPGAIILMSVVVAMGLMSYLGIPISIVGTTIPVLLVAIVSAYGIHQMNHYLVDPATDKRVILEHNMKSVGLAILLSGVTVMVGFGALAVEEFVPIKNFGIFVAVGDMVGVVGALWVLPSLILTSKKPKRPYHEDESKGPIAALLHGLVRLNQKHSVAVVVGAVLLSIVFGVGSLFVKTEMNAIAFFKPNHVLRQADGFLNEKLAGTTVLNVVLDSDLSDPFGRGEKRADAPTDIVTPEVLGQMEKFEHDLRQRFPQVGKVLSFNPVIKKINQEIGGNGDPKAYVIPDNKELISQYLMIFSGDVKNVMTADHDKLRMSVFMKRASTAETEQVREYAANYFPKDFLERNHLQVQVGGTAHLYGVTNDLLVKGMIHSVIICVIIVFFLLVFVLRNVRMSVVAIAPIGVAVLMNFGALGFLGIPLNIGTAIVSSIAIGIGVDYSIHFVTWYRSQLRHSADIVAALEHSIVHKGRAILYNMVIIVAGFVVLMLSEFVPLIQFGGLVSFCMVVTAAGSLVLVPAIIRVLATHGVKFIDLGAKVRPAQAAQPAQEAALPTPPQAGASAAGPTATA